MKLVLVFLLVLGVVYSCHAEGLGSLFCNPSRQQFLDRHEFYNKYASPPGKVWKHDRNIIAVQPDGSYATQFRFDTWAFNRYNEEECRFEGIEINPVFNGVGISYIVQGLESVINLPCLCGEGIADNAQTYDINWFTPAFAESQFVLGLKREHTAIGKASLSGTWTDEATDTLGFVESAFVPAPEQRALSLLAVPTQFAPGNKATTAFGAIITFTSDLITPPADVAEALRLFLAGELPLGPDPTDPTFQVFRYDPPVSARSVDGANEKALQNAETATEAIQYLKEANFFASK
jgi:hypothetical protein